MGLSSSVEEDKTLPEPVQIGLIERKSGFFGEMKLFIVAIPDNVLRIRQVRAAGVSIVTFKSLRGLRHYLQTNKIKSDTQIAVPIDGHRLFIPKIQGDVIVILPA